MTAAAAYADITCVELNPHYVEVGKKVVPEATWICADVLDPFLPDLLGQFDFAIGKSAVWPNCKQLPQKLHERRI